MQISRYFLSRQPLALGKMQVSSRTEGLPVPSPCLCTDGPFPLQELLTFCQTKASTVRILAPKYSLVDSEALLRRFAKYTLLQMEGECCPSEQLRSFNLSSRIPSVRYTILSETFRFVDTAHLLESETPDLLLPFSKDLTSGRETIVFGR